MNGVAAGGLVRCSTAVGVCTGALTGDKMNGISKCDYADGSFYYGHLVNNSQQGKGWKWNPVTFRSTKGEFYDNKAHGYGHDKVTTPTGEKFRWEGTFRGDFWHGLGIRTRESTG